MVTMLSEHKLAYFPVPKVACTSIKYFFFELENNRPFEPYESNGNLVQIHMIYPGKRFEKWDRAALADYLKLVVVRDPVARFLSCYGNRVLYHNALDGWEFTLTPEDHRKGVVLRPDLDQYITHFHRYRELSGQIRFHSDLMVRRIGDDPSYFDHLFNIGELDQFVEVVRARVGHAPEMGREQTEGPKFSPDDLSAAQRKFITDFYAEDYRVFGKYL